MKRFCIFLISILSVTLLSSCSQLNYNTINDIPNNTTQEPEIQESSSSILYMTDLEVIKKTADYLKSHGENLTFQETEITYLRNETDAVVCKDEKGKDVFYKGDYLQVKYYPHPDAGDKNQSYCIVVFMGEGGKILGYYKDKLSE